MIGHVATPPEHLRVQFELDGIGTGRHRVDYLLE